MAAHHSWGNENGAGANSSPAPSLTFEIYPPKRLEGKPPALWEYFDYLVLSGGFLRANTVKTPPWVLKLPASPKAPSAPRPAVGSSAPMPAATPIPAQPPMPESTATYCWPSGPLYVIGLPMMPDGVLYCHRVLPVFWSSPLSQPSMVP